jgi:hypothetical protein
LLPGSYIRKLKTSMERIHGLGFLLLIPTLRLEQNPVDLAQLPCATMPDGKCKEHYLEPLRNAELEFIHVKTVETTMEQNIKIDDELPDLT